MSPEERVLALLDYEPCADTCTWEVPQDMRKRITDAIRAAVAEERERCARVAEGCSASDIAEAIRATCTTAAYRDALASAAAHFGGAPVPTGAPTVADALTAGSRVLRDMASGTSAEDRDIGGEG